MLALKLGNSLSGLGKTGENIYSLAFNGTDESVKIDSVGADMRSTVGTISLWAKFNTVSASGSMIQTRVDANNLINLFYHASSNEIRFAYKGGGTVKTVVLSAGSFEGDGKWHHIAATWSTDADEIKLYVDGTLIGTTTGLGTFAGAIDECYIGQNTQDGAFFNGNLCEVAVFTRVVPIAELWIDKRQPINFIGASGIVGYWKFDRGSGIIALDSTSYANDGELENTPTWSTDVPYKSN